MSKKEKCNKISIYLIKENIKYGDILKDYVYQCELITKEKSKTYYVPTKVKSPNWLFDYYKQEGNAEIVNSRAKVISLHKVWMDGIERVFAIPFGSGLYLLNNDVVEEQFGLKILLNSVDKTDFRKINISNYGTDHRTKNEQMPKKTDITEFGFDIYNDFLREATAKSEEEIFYKNVITGGNLFSVSVPINIDTVDEFLKKCYERYKKNSYKEQFSWLDNIKEVKEKSMKRDLNNELLNQINERNFDKVWLAVPEVIEWEKVSDFRYKKTVQGIDDIELVEFLKTISDQPIENIELLKRRKIYAMGNDSDDPIMEWSVYNCLIGEFELEGGVYCLNYGRWYKVNKNFVNDINDYYKNVSLCNYEFPHNHNENEDIYNEKLCASLIDAILFDKKTIRINGLGKSSIELCDVYTNNKELIHVKKNGGSSYLSHLFNQAAVSGEMLLDKEFREEANKKIGKKIFGTNFNPNDYKIILAIITKADETIPKIPFFSKVSIRYAIDGLKRKGYKVEIKNIFQE
ncbi:MAG: TIGR04141 family sporadically distributed protein [Bacilli bacterium]|nr:TIGR04141 family sporadically distributed protein [Bacilli bacterium]